MDVAAQPHTALQTVFVDAHTHIYDRFDLDTFFKAAVRNFAIAAQQQNVGDRVTTALLLTETCKDNYFPAFYQKTQAAGGTVELTEEWVSHLTVEPCSLRLQHKPSGNELYLIAGRQVVTAEDLEVLALLTDQQFADGSPLDVTVNQVLSAGGLAVIPWGFGKWTGARGKILRRFLEEETRPEVCLGDNSGRPMFWWRSPHFEYGTAKGIRILPGTDPLPFTAETQRPGRFGFSLAVDFDPQHPAASLKAGLVCQECSLQPYGSLENPIRFFQNQVAMQIVKRTRSKA
jgi:hypothetical protein